ncbi:hypothetical protein J19TS1_31050 [Heyndrickxia oleronia]|nr:hypothetical protein J19TS1_31050 [Heyndrickxia oleronia]
MCPLFIQLNIPPLIYSYRLLFERKIYISSDSIVNKIQTLAHTEIKNMKEGYGWQTLDYLLFV